jgi:hypothetical protein
MNVRVGTLLMCAGLIAKTATGQIAGHVVISEVYGEGGNIGALYKNDFVELYNPTSIPVPLAGWSVQYASATGTGAWHAAPLGGHIPPFGYYLLQLSGGTNGIALPGADTTGSLNLSATAGKVALVKSTAPLSGAIPADSLVIDMIGYGDANWCEGSGPAPSPGTATSLERKATPGATQASMGPGGADANSGNGWDSNNNSADFVVQKTPNPQNTSAPPERPPDEYLPIRFGSIDAVFRVDAGVSITWSTLSETGCYGFEVQRSTNPTAGFLSISGLIQGHGTTLHVNYYSYADPVGSSGWYYRVREIDTNGAEWFSESVVAMPVTSAKGLEQERPALLQNYPNPFNPETMINYRLVAGGNVKLGIYDVLGRSVCTLEEGKQPPGDYALRWDATASPAGLYFCRLESGGIVRILKLVLLR